MEIILTQYQIRSSMVPNPSDLSIIVIIAEIIINYFVTVLTLYIDGLKTCFSGASFLIRFNI